MITYDSSDPPGPFGHENADEAWSRFQGALETLEARANLWALLDSDPDVRNAALIAAHVLGVPVASYQKRHKDRGELSLRRTRGAIRMRAHEAKHLFEQVAAMKADMWKACERVAGGYWRAHATHAAATVAQAVKHASDASAITQARLSSARAYLCDALEEASDERT